MLNKQTHMHATNLFIPGVCETKGKGRKRERERERVKTSAHIAYAEINIFDDLNEMWRVLGVRDDATWSEERSACDVVIRWCIDAIAIDIHFEFKLSKKQ